MRQSICEVFMPNIMVPTGQTYIHSKAESLHNSTRASARAGIQTQIPDSHHIRV